LATMVPYSTTMSVRGEVKILWLADATFRL
jgi:hypothetical protein